MQNIMSYIHTEYIAYLNMVAHIFQQIIPIINGKPSNNSKISDKKIKNTQLLITY